MLPISITLLFLFELVSSLTTTPLADFGESSTFSADSLRLSETYVRVMKKMDDYCEQRYNETDDKIIDMYTHCFSNLLRAVSLDVGPAKAVIEM